MVCIDESTVKSIEIAGDEIKVLEFVSGVVVFECGGIDFYVTEDHIH